MKDSEIDGKVGIVLRDKINQIGLNIYEQCCWNADAIGGLKALYKHALAINETRHGAFFGFIQNVLVDYLVIGLCKIYEKPDTRTDRMQNSIWSVCKILKENPALIDNVFAVEIVESEIFSIPQNQKAALYENRVIIVNRIEGYIQSLQNSCQFSKIEDFRNKIAAHSQVLQPNETQWAQTITTLENMQTLNASAIKAMSRIYHGLNLGDFGETWISAPQALTATLNLLELVLDKDFNDSVEGWELRQEFRRVE